MQRDDEFSPAFPKPKAREKKPKKGLNRGKGVNKVRPEGKRNYNPDQRARRRAEDTQYRRFSRPLYLLGLARKQGRLHRTDEQLPGEFPNDKLRMLTPDEIPLCEVGASESKCDGKLPALHVHHTKGRGPHLNDPATYLGVCRNCHDHIENNRAWARERGYLQTRHASRQGDTESPF